MPSPIAHCSLAILAWPRLRSSSAQPVTGLRRLLLFGGLLFSLCAPDLDIFIGPLLGYQAFEMHGAMSHSFLLAPVWGIIFALYCRLLIRSPWLIGWVIGTAAYASHVLLDIFTRGSRGIMWMWPFAERLPGDWWLFYGVEHSQPWAWHLHLVTIANETFFAVILWALYFYIRNRLQRSRVSDETISTTAIES